MHNSTASLIRKLWHYCNVLRDDGLSYPDYVEQLTYLLFLKLADEQAPGLIPDRFGWSSFERRGPESVHRHYSRILAVLGQRTGMLGLIFKNARNKIKDPAKLRLLVVDLIGQTEWSVLSSDVKGDAYEGLLEKNARDTKSGAGQYFTPRPLINAMVTCIDPQPREVICDPACGTGGFLLASYQHIRSRHPRMTVSQLRHLATKSLHGVELVEEVARLATMNLLLHGIGSATGERDLPITCADSLKHPPSSKVDVVLTNPPFGVKGSITYSGESRSQKRDELTILRPDFWVQTANKQLNFLQHIMSLLKPSGRAAVVVPNNVLFEAGAAASVRRRLLECCDVHTLLRLPPGLFYAQGVKANVLFFERLPKAAPSSDRALWVYDFRYGNQFSVKTRPLKDDDLTEFITLYRPSDRQRRTSNGNRWRAVDISGILDSEECSLDLSWNEQSAREGEGAIARLDEISRLIADDLVRALAHTIRGSSGT